MAGRVGDISRWAGESQVRTCGEPFMTADGDSDVLAQVLHQKYTHQTSVCQELA